MKMLNFNFSLYHQHIDTQPLSVLKHSCDKMKKRNEPFINRNHRSTGHNIVAMHASLVFIK